MYLQELDDDDITDEIAYLDVALTNYTERRKFYLAMRYVVPIIAVITFLVIYWN